MALLDFFRLPEQESLHHQQTAYEKIQERGIAGTCSHRDGSKVPGRV